MEPKYLSADEPTGNLDSVNGETVMQIIRESNAKLGTTVVMVTHDAGFANMAKRKIDLADGRIVN
jgi:putative ABC transport system ATP-binding protein